MLEGANQRHPIRSFLIDSARAMVLTGMPVQKIFNGGGYDTAHAVSTRSRRCAKLFSRDRLLTSAICDGVKS
jgi:hypothetical protein